MKIESPDSTLKEIPHSKPLICLHLGSNNKRKREFSCLALGNRIHILVNLFKSNLKEDTLEEKQPLKNNRLVFYIQCLCYTGF